MSILEHVVHTDLIKETAYSKIFVGRLDDSSKVIIKLLKHANMDVLQALTTVPSIHFPKILELSEHTENGETELTVIEEYIEGDTLSELLQKRKLSSDEIYSLMLQLCEGISFLHQMNPPFIHRDIKPQNLILDKQGTLRIIDLNTTRVFKSNSSHDTVYLGTAEYAPPEQFGYSQTDVRSDIYCMGMTLYEMIYGKHFDRKSKQLLSSANALDTIIARCTMYDPKQRYQSIQELQADLIHHCKTSTLHKNTRNKPFLLTLALCGLSAVLALILSLRFWVPQEASDSKQLTKSVLELNEHIYHIASTNAILSKTDPVFMRQSDTVFTIQDEVKISGNNLQFKFPPLPYSRIDTIFLYDADGDLYTTIKVRHNPSSHYLLHYNTGMRIDEAEYNLSDFALSWTDDMIELSFDATDILGMSAANFAGYSYTVVSHALPKLPAPTDITWTDTNQGLLSWNSEYPCAEFLVLNNDIKGYQLHLNNTGSYTSNIAVVLQDKGGDYFSRIMALGDWEHGDSDLTPSDILTYIEPRSRLPAVTGMYFEGTFLYYDALENVDTYSLVLYGYNPDIQSWEYTGQTSTTDNPVDMSKWIELYDDFYPYFAVSVYGITPDTQSIASGEETDVAIYFK